MSVIQREPADKPGDEIVSSILATPASQIERGRQEINYSSTDRVIKSGVIVASAFILPGSVVAVQDRSNISLGMLTEFSISTRNGFVSTEISVECVL
jgi:hypothetical protein